MIAHHASHQDLLDWLLLQHLLLILQRLDPILQLLDVLLVPSQVVLSLDLELLLNQVCQLTKLVLRQWLPVDELISLRGQVD